MIRLTPLAVLLLALVGCTSPDTYPITGAECGPDDPVKTIDAVGCVPSGAGGV